MDHVNIIKRLNDNGYEAFVVGGAVRDYILGNMSPKDFDVVTSARPNRICDLFSDCEVKIVGKSFGVVIVDGVDVATYRQDNYAGLSDKNAKITFIGTLEEDLARRDFTFNAMASDIHGNLIDPFNGQKDLENRVVRFVGDAQERINEDPNRILRALRFCATIEGKLHNNTANAIMNNEHLIKYIAPERIRLEILKVMKTKNPSIFFETAVELGILRYLFPELAKCVSHPHGNYHTEDVFAHCMIVGDELPSSDPILRLTGFLHDIGKPASYNEEDGSFIDHHTIGAEILHENLEWLKFSTEEITRITGLVERHMDYRGNEFSPKSCRKIITKLGESKVTLSDSLRLRIADRKGNLNKNPYTFKEIRDVVNAFRKCNLTTRPSAHSLALSGKDIIEITGLKPGKIIGDIQKSLVNYIIENGGDFNTREWLIPQLNYFMVNLKFPL